MDIQELWEKARKQTEIVRCSLHNLKTFETTAVPYLFLAESTLHPGDTIVRKGQVLIERPAIVLPDFSPQFQGFEFQEDLHVSNEAVTTFLLMRGIQFPSLRYRHEHSSLDLLETSLKQALEQYTQTLTKAEDVTTGLVVGPEDAWKFSLLLLVGALVVRSAEGDLRHILEAWRKRQQG